MLGQVGPGVSAMRMRRAWGSKDTRKCDGDFTNTNDASSRRKPNAV